MKKKDEFVWKFKFLPFYTARDGLTKHWHFDLFKIEHSRMGSYIWTNIVLLNCSFQCLKVL